MVYPFDRAMAIAQSMEAADSDAHTLRGGDAAQQGASCQILQQYYLQNIAWE